MSSALISIVVPVYNAEKYLERCLDSLLAQRYAPLEIILVDDGSMDSSGAICDEYASRNAEGHTFRVIHQKNTGASIARKNGIASAKGEYITFVDADDVVSPHYVSALYEAMAKHGTSMAVCRYEIGKEAHRFSFAERVESRLLSEKELFERFFKYEFWGFPGALYRKDLFAAVEFPAATVNEDYYVKAQLFCRDPKVAEVTSPLYYYEKHEGSLSNLQVSERALGEFDNACATWEMVKRKQPEYSQHANAIVSEVATKWLYQLNKISSKKKDAALDIYRERIQNFTSDNWATIACNSHLYWKIKVSLFAGYIKSLKGA